MTYIWHCGSPLGGIILASNGAALTGLRFNDQRFFGETPDRAYKEANLPVFEETARWLSVYFSGRAPDAAPPLRLCGTPFRKAVWEYLRSVPFGQTVTYGEIAAYIRPGVSAQAVGGAVSHNPIALIIPCHRVIGANGKLTGYTGGLWRKEKLLALESGDSAFYAK